MIYGCVLLAVAALVVVAAVVCWLAGVQLVALVKIALGACAVLLTVAGVIVVSGDLLLSAGYFGSGRGEPNKQTTVIPPDRDYVPVEQRAPTSQETQHWLHEETVRFFTESQGNGRYRMPPMPIDDIIAKPKPKSQDDPKGTSPVVGGGDPKQGTKPGQMPLRGHIGVEQAIVGRTLFSSTTNATELWTVRKVQLVGLIQHAEPTVYLTDKLPNMKEPKDMPTRQLDAFEKTALEALRGGENLKSETNGKEMRLMGPIYAGSRCVSCHDKGQMLGAFTYQLELVPLPTNPPKSRLRLAADPASAAVQQQLAGLAAKRHLRQRQGSRAKQNSRHLPHQCIADPSRTRRTGLHRRGRLETH